MPSMKPASPRVSVIVPNFNHARFLKQRIDSILEQTYQDFDILLLDDASSDGSAALLQQYRSHPKVAGVVVNPHNTGSPYKQWNRGIRQTSGEFVWIAESDDYADPHFLERMLALMDTHPKVGIAFCRSYKVDAESTVFGTTADWTAPLHPTRWDHDYVNNGRDECARWLLRRCIIPNVSSALLRRSALERAGLACDEMRFCGDYFTYVRLLTNDDIGYLAAPLNYFRFSSSSVRTQMSGAWLHDYERAQIIAHIAANFPLAPQCLDTATDEFVEHLLRATAGGGAAARAYLARYFKMRGVLRRFCPLPEVRSLQLLARLSSRKAAKLLAR